MSITIWHNPRCSKSRATLALLQDNRIEPTIRLYLENAPSAAELREVLGVLGIKARGLVRKGELAYKEAGLSAESSEKDLIEAMVGYPKLIERPIVHANGKARIGRPPEAVLDIL